MELSGTDRDRLAEFYSSSLYGNVIFFESVDYLRNHGTIDRDRPQQASCDHHELCAQLGELPYGLQIKYSNQREYHNRLTRILTRTLI